MSMKFTYNKRGIKQILEHMSQQERDFISDVLAHVKPERHNISDEDDRVVQMYWVGNNDALTHLEAKIRELGL